MEKVSLILTTYNCKDNLKRTLQSIESQDYENIQVVIEDGVSTDGTLEMIQEYQKKSRHEVIWHSEPDAGIYDAMNKGYKRSTGSIIGFFNDLFLTDRAVSLLAAAVKNDAGLVGVHADLVYATDEKVKRCWRTGEGRIQSGWMPGHPTLFLRREVYERFGLYNTTYKCSADYEFMVRILKNNQVKLTYIPKKLIRMFYGGTSTGSSGAYMVSIKEAHRALAENQVRFAWLVVLLRTLRTIPQFLFTDAK